MLKTFFSGCNHWRQPVPVGRYTVTCSSIGRELKEPHPDFGVYLTNLWKEKIGGIIWTNGVTIRRAAHGRAYPAMIVDWTDMGTVPVEQLEDIVEVCLSKMRAGKRIDIACAAGHGRTGTLLACLVARVEHLPAREAIAAVRFRYCPHACETLAQEQLVGRYVAQHVSRNRWFKKPAFMLGKGGYRG